MIGRVDKGIIITTGTFIPNARKGAARDGVSPIELVDERRIPIEERRLRRDLAR